MRYVYVLRNLITGKVYVGQTTNPKRREWGHFAIAKQGNERPLYRSIRKHGKENFKFEVIEECNDDLINEREQFWVAHYDSYNDEKGYNLTKGGQSKITKETREKLQSAAAKGGSKSLTNRWNNPQWRKQQCKRISDQNRKLHKEGKLHHVDWTGRKHSEESKRKIGKANSKRQMGIGNSQHGTVWIHNFDESRKIQKEHLQLWESRGWRRGRVKRYCVRVPKLANHKIFSQDPSRLDYVEYDSFGTVEHYASLEEAKCCAGNRRSMSDVTSSDVKIFDTKERQYASLAEME